MSFEGGGSGVYKHESLDLRRVFAINVATQQVAFALGLKVFNHSSTPGVVETLSLFARRKPKLTIVFASLQIPGKGSFHS